MKRLLQALYIAAGCAALCTEAQAATEGSPGSTSTGSLNFTVTKPARADITNLTDMQLPSWVAGDGAVKMTEDVCIYSTRPSGGYTVLATGSGSSEAFTLADGSNTLDYGVAWNSGGVGHLSDTGTALTANLTSGGLTGAATDSSSCSGSVPGPTARLIISIPAGTMASAGPGIYTGTLTLTVTPN